MNRLRKISYLGLVLGFILLLAGALVVTFYRVYPGVLYSTAVVIPGAALVILGLFYRWKS